MNIDNGIRHTKIGLCCLDPDMKRERIMTKAAILEGRMISNNDILQEIERKQSCMEE